MAWSDAFGRNETDQFRRRFVYNTGPDLLPGAFLNDTAHFQSLVIPTSDHLAEPNVYIEYIVTHFEELPDMAIFAQAESLDHAPEFGSLIQVPEAFGDVQVLNYPCDTFIEQQATSLSKELCKELAELEVHTPFGALKGLIDPARCQHRAAPLVAEFDSLLGSLAHPACEACSALVTGSTACQGGCHVLAALPIDLDGCLLVGGAAVCAADQWGMSLGPIPGRDGSDKDFLNFFAEELKLNITFALPQWKSFNALFAASRASIRRTPLASWKLLLDWLTDDADLRLVPASRAKGPGRFKGLIMEVMWLPLMGYHGGSVPEGCALA